MSNSHLFLLSLLAWSSLFLSTTQVSAVRRFQFKLDGNNTTFHVNASINYSWPTNPYKAALQRGIKVAADNFPGVKTRPFSVNIKFKSLAKYAVISRSKLKWVEMPSPNPQKVLIQAPTYKAIFDRPPLFAANYTDPFDIEIHLDNSTDWHTKKDGPIPRDRYDLSTVVLNELYRSFIFSGFLKLNDAKTKAYLKNDRISRYDSLLEYWDRCPLLEDPQEYWLEAVTNGKIHLKISNERSEPVYTPSTYVEGTSIYSLNCHTDFKMWQVGCENLPRGLRNLKVSEQLKRVQAAYLDLRNVPQKGNQKCLNRHKNTEQPGIEKGKPKKSKKLIGGMPVWVFGLCLVVLCIVLAILIFALCTIGAVQKQKEQPSCWKRFTCCCTALNTEPEPVGISTGDNQNNQNRPGGSSSALFTYIDTSTAQRYSLEGNLLGGVNSPSFSGLRNSFDVVRYAFGRPNAPTNANNDADDNVSHGIATAETVLPGRLDNL